MQSHVWDSSSVKLPRRYNKDLPGWRMKAEFGIPQAKIMFVHIVTTLDLYIYYFYCYLFGGVQVFR